MVFTEKYSLKEKEKKKYLKVFAILLYLNIFCFTTTAICLQIKPIGFLPLIAIKIKARV